MNKLPMNEEGRVIGGESLNDSVMRAMITIPATLSPPTQDTRHTTESHIYLTRIPTPDHPTPRWVPLPHVALFTHSSLLPPIPHFKYPTIQIDVDLNK